jgi:hypothetical protein
MAHLRVDGTKEGILTARAIEDRLYDETWALRAYDVLHRLELLSIPTLIIHGEYDFVPQECAAHIAQAIPAARLELLQECGHFSYMGMPGCGAQRGRRLLSWRVGLTQRAHVAATPNRSIQGTMSRGSTLSGTEAGPFLDAATP